MRLMGLTPKSAREREDASGIGRFSPFAVIRHNPGAPAAVIQGIGFGRRPFRLAQAFQAAVKKAREPGWIV